MLKKSLESILMLFLTELSPWIQFHSFLIITEENLYPPPNDINLADVQPGKLIFNWTSVISNCSTLQYNIASTSDCGTCTVVTNTTAFTAVCSDLLLTANAIVCHFSVSSHACDLIGNPSVPFEVTLKCELQELLYN